MRITSHRATCRVFGLLILSLCTSLSADVMESARMLPEDVMFMASVESVSELWTAAQKTSLYSLYKDPAMQEFVRDSEKMIRESIDAKLKDFWQEMKVENPPEAIPWPEGRLLWCVSFFKQSSETGSEKPQGNDMGFRMAVLADMGSRVEQTRQMMQSLSTSAANSGAAVAKKEIGGVELNALVPKGDSEGAVLRYGLKDNWLVVTLDTSRGVEFTESVVKRIGRSMPGSLAEKEGFYAAVRTLGDAQVFAFVNVDTIRSLIVSRAPKKAQVERLIKALGLSNVTGIAGAIQIAGQRNQEMISKTLVAIDGPRTGIPALLSESSGPLKINNRLVTRDAVGFLCVNCVPVKIFDGIAKILQEAVFQDLNMIAAAAMVATAGEGGQPAVQVRDDVLAQMGTPLLATWRMDKPYTSDAPAEFVASLSVQDGARLDTALGRIHRAFLGSRTELRRELLDHAVYLLPSVRVNVERGSADEGAAFDEENLAFAVAGDSFVFGQVGEVEQAIRSIGSEPANAITSDPMFRYAGESLPSQACLYAYRNDRLNAEITWTSLRQMARDLAKQGKDESDEETDLSDPIATMLQKARKYMDLSRLPEFEVVQKYWGASVGYMQSRPEGLYWESIVLRPPLE